MLLFNRFLKCIKRVISFAPEGFFFFPIERRNDRAREIFHLLVQSLNVYNSQS